jgi:hypothetical protein
MSLLKVNTVETSFIQSQEASEFIKIDNGNFGIGTLTPTAINGGKVTEITNSTSLENQSDNQDFIIKSTNANSSVYIISKNDKNTNLYFGDNNNNSVGYLQYNHASNFLATYVNASERFRIDSQGYFYFGSTNTSYVYAGSSVRWFGYMLLSRDTTTNTNQIAFFNPNGAVGSINTSGSSTSYGTTSDYRLKKNVVPIENALTIVGQLKPVRFNWKVDDSPGQGFIAHELQEIVPECVNGEKDKVDSNGNPIYQNVDTSFLVAILTKSIQELKNELDLVKSELAILKGNN